MHVLHRGSWEGGFLDYHRGPQDCRIEPFAWCVLAPIDDLYFVRPRSARLVVNYARDVGLRTTVRKIASRRAEGVRNAKFLSCGVGRLVEGPSGFPAGPGDPVAFVATAHPEAADRISVPAALAVPASAVAPNEPGSMLHVAHVGAPPPELAELAGWSPFAGDPIDPARAVEAATRILAGALWADARRLPLEAPEPIAERHEHHHDQEDGRPRAVLVGLGNYAKTAVLPHVREWLDVTCVHELDPLQIPRAGRRMTFDTAPVPRTGLHYDAHLIAGFHASHADLAVRALNEGAAAVIEKPVATGDAQLERLCAAVEAPGRAFACFQRRHHPFNEHVKHDLSLTAGDPVDYHAIVYEEPLPAHHWYGWPASGTRLLSNGCHWLDHFLWLNAFSPPVDSELAVSRSGAVNCSVALANGAFLTLVLTDRGSRRIGVREHCELRAGGATATIRDGRHYRAEDGSRVLRRARCDKHEPYRRMYRDVARRIAEGLPGDTRETIEVSGRLAIDLDARLRRLSSRP